MRGCVVKASGRDQMRRTVEDLRRGGGAVWWEFACVMSVSVSCEGPVVMSESAMRCSDCTGAVTEDGCE